MSDASARFDLPFIMPGQAQKELFHNEALVRIDALLHLAVEGVADAPPEDATEGACWIIGLEPTGDWAGRAGHVACQTAGGWRYIAPVPGMQAWCRDRGRWSHWDGVLWTDAVPVASVTIGGLQVLGPRLEEVSSPSGGETIDAEARAAIDAVIATLKSHGLIE